MTRNYVLYLRVSTDEQGKSGLGLDAQLAACRAFIEREGGAETAIFQDVLSGKHDDRPALQQALRAAKKAKAFVLVSKLDRLSREVHFIAGLIKDKVRFVTAEFGHDADEMMLHMYATLAEKERKLIGERTKAAMGALKRQGKVLGNRINLDVAQARGRNAMIAQAERGAERIMPLIDTIKTQGITTHAAIAAELNRLNVRTPRGGEWHPTSVGRVINRLAK